MHQSAILFKTERVCVAKQSAHTFPAPYLPDSKQLCKARGVGFVGETSEFTWVPEGTGKRVVGACAAQNGLVMASNSDKHLASIYFSVDIKWHNRTQRLLSLSFIGYTQVCGVMG